MPLVACKYLEYVNKSFAHIPKSSMKDDPGHRPTLSQAIILTIWWSQCQTQKCTWSPCLHVFPKVLLYHPYAGQPHGTLLALM